MIKQITLPKLEEKCLDLISKTYLELGQHNIEAEQKVVLCQALAKDLINTFPTFYWKDVEESFRLGVRGSEQTFIHLNVPTYILWLKRHRELIWNDIYRHDMLGEDKDTLPYYRDTKLLK